MPDGNTTLLFMLVLPIVLGLVVLVFPKRWLDPAKYSGWVAFIGSLILMLMSLGLLANFDFEADGLQMAATVEWLPAFGLNFGYGIDAISLWLILLTTILMPLAIWGSFSAVSERHKEYYMWLLILEAAMLGVFMATDIIFFYICFEFTLIPMFFLIGVFGSNNRLKAAKVFFLYTFTGSMLTFAGVLYVAWFNAAQTGAWSFQIADLVASAQHMESSTQVWVMLAMLAGFAVKVPLFPVHTWLPLAHTEAPTAGSVVLAGVLLKLGTYALVRLALPVAPAAAVIVAPWVGTLAVIGILYTALICWVQKDIKKLVAYSSVSHLGFCVLGMFAINDIGISGSVMYMVNHGLSTGALFLCIGMIYERFHTRQMKDMGGLARVIPVWSCFMVFFSLASVGLPGLNGFVGEFLTLMGSFQSDHLGWQFAAPAGVGMIFGAIYLLYMVGKVVFGPVKVPAHHDGDHAADDGHGHDHPEVADLTPREIAILSVLAVGCVWLGVYPKPVLDSLDKPVTAIVETVDPGAKLPLPRLKVDDAGSDRADDSLVLADDVTASSRKAGGHD